MQLHLRAIAFSFALLLAADVARATLVRVEYSGSIDSVAIGPDSGALVSEIGDSMHVGTTFSGWFEFDDAALPNRSIVDPITGGLYEYEFRNESEANFRSDVGRYSAGPGLLQDFGPGPGFGITLWTHPNESESELVVTVNYPGWATGTATDFLSGFRLSLIAHSGVIPLSGSLVDLPWDPASFRQPAATWVFGKGGIYDDDHQGVQFSGAIDAFSVHSVPEAPVAALVAATALTCAGVAFRRASL